MKRERAPIGWPETTVLDQFDRAIILALQTDGRMSYARLAEAVALSQPAARQRVNRMVEAGVMEIVALTDPLRLRFRVHADLGLNVSGDPRPVVEALRSLREIVYLRYSAGRFEIMADVLFEASGEMHAFVNGRLGEIPGIDRVETIILLERVKETHDWAVPERVRDAGLSRVRRNRPPTPNRCANRGRCPHTRVRRTSVECTVVLSPMSALRGACTKFTLSPSGSRQGQRLL